MSNNAYPYAHTGPRDEVKSVGYSDTREDHSDNKRTTYVRDYKGEEPTLEGYGTMFKTGLIGPADIGKNQFFLIQRQPNLTK